MPALTARPSAPRDLAHLSSMSVGRPSRSSAALAAAAPGTVVVVAAVVLTVRRIHTGSADQQDLTATVVAGDLAAVALAVTLLGLLWAGVRRARAGVAARASLLEADAVGTHLGRWPRLGRASLETLGVREPRTSAGRRRAQLPYVPRRTMDRRLRDALGGHWFVLVHGPAAVGKSRSVVETCAALFGDRTVVAPAVRDGALSRLLDADVIPGRRGGMARRPGPAPAGRGRRHRPAAHPAATGAAGGGHDAGRGV